MALGPQGVGPQGLGFIEVFVGLGFRVYGLGVFSCEVGWLMTGPSITALDLDQ